MTEEPKRTKWERLSLGGDPHVVLGKRSGKRIRSIRLDVHKDFYPELRRVCDGAVTEIANTEGRAYEPEAGLETGEQHFYLSSTDVGALLNPTMEETKSIDPAESGSSPQKEAALLACLRDPMNHKKATQEEYESFDPFFYAICWQQEDLSWLAFVRKTNPQQFFKLGRIWCQYSSTLKKLDKEPTFALDHTIDVLVHAEDIVSLSPSALNFLFTDVRLVQSGVPGQVASLRDTLRSSIPLSDRSAKSLVASGSKLKTSATRIYALSSRIAEIQETDALTPDRYREIAGDDEKALALLNDDGTLDFDEEGAKVFLDVIEGRYFEDGWTGAPRRADRFSRR